MFSDPEFNLDGLVQIPKDNLVRANQNNLLQLIDIDTTSAEIEG